jgi:hypothetical protein
MDLRCNSRATRPGRLRAYAFLVLAATGSASLVFPPDLPAETEPATVRVGAVEGWGRTPQPWDDPASNLVGETGDPELIEFTGNATFPARIIREQLMMSASYLLGSHHLALRGPFLVMLRDKIRDGYQNCGFPDAQVEVRYDRERRRAEVRIVEGKRFRCGDVTVEGVAPEVVKSVVTQLTIRPESKYPEVPTGGGAESGNVTLNAEVRPGSADSTRPLARDSEQTVFWETGEPVSFVETIRLELEAIVQKALAQHGLFFPRLEVKIQTDAEKATALLLVKILDPGPRAVIDEILVEGNRKNSKAEILEFLGLKTGQPITRATLDLAERKLWDSGRFRLYALEPELTPAENPASRRVRLVIRVVEFESIPKLNEELSPKQKALLLLGRYISGMAGSGEELVLRATGLKEMLPVDISWEVILAPRKGFSIRLTDPVAPKPGYAYAIELSDSTVAMYDQTRGSRLVITNAELSLRAFLRLVPTPPDETNTVNFSVGAGFAGSTSDDKARQPGMDFEFTIAPAALVEQAKNLDGEAVLADGRWTITDSNVVLRIDARSGRLEELKWSSTDLGGTNGEISVLLTNRAFEATTLAMAREGSGGTNRYVAEHPTTSTVSFLVGEILRIGLARAATNLPAARRELLASSFERLISPGFLDLDRDAKPDPTEPVFAIPLDATDVAIAQNNLLALFSGVVFRYCSEWFPKYSWPWTLARESVLVLASKGVYAEGELERLSRSEDTGPVGSLATAYLLGQINPAAGRTFATRGLTRLSATDFKADCRLLLEGDSALAKTFAQIAASLGKMPEKEVEALAANLPPEEATLLTDSARALRQSPGQPLMKALSPALETYWNSTLKGIIRAKLLKLSVSLQSPPRTRTDL